MIYNGLKFGRAENAGRADVKTKIWSKMKLVWFWISELCALDPLVTGDQKVPFAFFNLVSLFGDNERPS